MPTTTDVLKYVGRLYYVSLERLLDTRRRDTYVLLARRTATRAFRRRGLSFSQIARIMNYADHSTPLHNDRVAGAQEVRDPEFARKVAAVVEYAGRKEQPQQ